MTNSTPSLLLDLYELTMAASYFKHRRKLSATFDLFIRRLPKNRSYFIATGLEDCLRFLKNFKFNKLDLDYLKSLKLFNADFLDYLSTLRFRGDVWALPEGSVFFPNEPIIRVTAPIIQAQIIESFLLNTVNIQTTISTKAARVVSAAKKRPVFDFSLRRAQGKDAGLKAARSSFIAGANGSSNCLAGLLYGIPAVGTMAHSFVMSFPREIDAFRAFGKSFPDNSILLIDTYDYKKGLLNAIAVAKELERENKKLKGIRLDSGDLVKISKQARRLLDSQGLGYVKIFASGNLDEYKISKLIKKNAKIDSFGVGTNMGISKDAPYCDVIYKLSQIQDEDGKSLPTMKLSQDKITYPGMKQIFRIKNKKGQFAKDILALEKENIKGQRLLVKVMESGRLIYDLPKTGDIRNYALKNISLLPHRYKALKKSEVYPVKVSKKLQKLVKQISKLIESKQ